MKTGKLPPELLARLLNRLPAFQVNYRDERVRIGPRPGEDAAAIDLSGETLIVTTDPVTLVAGQAARYAVQVNANDIAAMGAEPAWLAATVLLPPSASESEVADLFEDLYAACAEANVSLVTGHTEVTSAVLRPVVVGTMLGVVARDAVVTSGGARPGDAVLLAGPAGIEGTAALASEAAAELLAAGLSQAELDRAGGLLANPGISVVPASRIIRGTARPHALHDATEGGIATALHEVAEASAAGMVIYAERLPILDVTRRICGVLGLDPLGLISSGCLIAAVAAGDAQRTLAALHDVGVMASQVGEVTSESRLNLRASDVESALPVFERDELARYLEDRDRNQVPTPPRPNTKLT